MSALLACVAAAPALAQTYAQFKTALPMIQRAATPEVEGRMGRPAMDPVSGRLYIPAMSTGTITAMNQMGLKAEQVIRDVPGPQGTMFLADQRRLLVACGDGSVRTYKADDKGLLTFEREIFLGGEADAMRLDAKSKRVWVAHGKFVSWINPESGEKGKRIEMPALAEGLAIEQNGPRGFVSIPSEGKVVVIDREKNEIVGQWTLKDIKGNHPIDLDEKNGRLFVAARNPGKLVVLSSGDGKEIARLDIGDDCDTLIYDAPSTRIFAVCGGGAGEITMVLQESADAYKVEHKVQTASGTRTATMFPVPGGPQTPRRFIALSPKIGDQMSFIYTYIPPP